MASAREKVVDYEGNGLKVSKNDECLKKKKKKEGRKC